MSSLTGTGVALITPFHTDKTIDFDALGKMVEYVVRGGVEYIVALGTTGESSTLSKEEKKQVTGHIIRTVNQRVPIVLGMGGNDTMAVEESIRSYDFSGISAILSVSPYYNRPSQKGIYEHFSAVARVSPLPVILYNVPGRTASNIAAETVVQLAKNHRNITGIKEASGNLVQIMQILRDKPDDFQVISGDDALTLPMIHVGCSGVISVIANSHPQHFSEMVRKAINKDFEAANKLHFRLLDYISALFEEGSPAGVKASLELMGICNKMVRLPLMPASDNLMAKLKTMIAEIG